MIAPARKLAGPAARPNPVDVFIARAEARAKLWQAGEIDLHEAVDELQASAIASGLVDAIGQDEVQALMATAFAAVRDDLVADVVPDQKSDLVEVEPAEHGVVAASTIMAAKYLVREGDVERLKRWLAKHGADERAAIHQHLEAKQCRSRQNK